MLDFLGNCELAKKWNISYKVITLKDIISDIKNLKWNHSINKYLINFV